MSLSHDSFTFFSLKHSPIVAVQSFDLPLVIGQFFGVLGESHITGEPFGRELSCDLVFDGYTGGPDALETDLRTLDSKIGKLTGTLTEVLGSDTRTFPQCTFVGYQALGEPFRDGSGQNGWVLFTRLFWRQRKRHT